MSKKFRRDSILYANRPVVIIPPDVAAEKKLREIAPKMYELLGIKENRYERDRRERSKPSGKGSSSSP